MERVNSNALIGHTGFVGSNIQNQKEFKFLYNSKNIEDIKGKEFNLIVCSAAPGSKWVANKEPKNDWLSIQRLMNNLGEAKAKKFVLISTIDVYPVVNEVNEDTPIVVDDLLPYGKHRRALEKFVEEHFNSTIIRLPGLFGNGLKKNIIYDFMHASFRSIHQNGLFQFYYLQHIWKDIQKSLDNNLKVINFATEPVLVQELAKEVFGVNFNNDSLAEAPYYDMRTKYGYLWDNDIPYLYSKSKVLADIKLFVKQQL